jgi:hypothetical protein
MILCISLFGAFQLKADNALHIGFVVGLAVPNDKVSQFYNESKHYFD